ncbi:hypothetical protein [Absidia glauca]|uniref:Uncharacterized protein n=1 Tax=Absidia glauca TaxID=4829 RepID=A0A163KN27_ABSGL|nr:hypothetical protein [Absidia glauca]
MSNITNSSLELLTRTTGTVDFFDSLVARESPAIVEHISTNSPSADGGLPVRQVKRRNVKKSLYEFYLLDLRYTYQCQQYPEPKPSTSNVNRRIGTIACGCTASIKISPNSGDPSILKVVYNWIHVGHTLGTVENMSSAPTTRDARLALKLLVWANLMAICQLVSVDGTPRLLLLVDTASQKLEQHGRRNVYVCNLLGWAIESKYQSSKDDRIPLILTSSHVLYIDGVFDKGCWYRTLKEVYLQKLGSQRVDILVYVLMDMVLPDFMADCVKTGALFQSGGLTIAEKRRRRLANGINDDDDDAGMINNDVPRAIDTVESPLTPRQRSRPNGPSYHNEKSHPLFLNTNTDRMLDLKATSRYDDRAVSNVLHSGQMMANIWSAIKDVEYPMRQTITIDDTGYNHIDL